MVSKSIFRAATDADRPEILALVELVFGADVAERHRRDWDWMFKQHPHQAEGWAPVELIEIDGQIACVIFCFPSWLTIEGQEVETFWMTSVLSHPEKRGTYLSMLWSLNEYPAYFYGLPSPESEALYKKVFRGSVYVPAMDYFKPVRPGRLAALKGQCPMWLGRGLDVFARPALSALHRLRNLSSLRGYETATVDTFGVEFDDLWWRVSQNMTVVAKRDSAFLNWRFSQFPNRIYKIHIVRREDRLIGYAVTRIAENAKGRREGRIVDILIDPTHINCAAVLLRISSRDLSKSGADHVKVKLAKETGDNLCKALNKNGFWINKSTRPVVGNCSKDLGFDEVLRNPKNWYFTMADADLDF